jgi:hypothetical protein
VRDEGLYQAAPSDQATPLSTTHADETGGASVTTDKAAGGRTASAAAIIDAA